LTSETFSFYQHRRSRLEASSPWKPENSKKFRLCN